jgi:predicted amidohydrolase
MTKVALAMAQIEVEPGEPAVNLRRACQAVAEAARAGCDLVVLPECLDLGWGDTSARDLAQPLPGPHSQMLASAAQANGIVVAAGLVERSGSSLFNSAVLVDTEGRIRLHHRKIHELDEVVSHLYRHGEQLAVSRLRLGGHEHVVGLNICADNAPDSIALGQALGWMGAQLIVSPCGWAVPPGFDNDATPYGASWRASYGQLAREHGLYVVGVSGVGRLRHGPWAGWSVIGSSLAVGPDGVLSQAPFGSAALEVVEVPLAPIS